MEEKLRRKFIFIAVFAGFIVLFFIGTFINLSNYIQIGKRADDLLKVLVENDGYFPQKEGGHKENDGLSPKIPKEAPFSTRFFSVKIDEDNNLMTVDTGKISAITTEQAMTYANQVLKTSQMKGYMDDYRYMIAKKDYGSVLVFMDCSQDLQMFYGSLKNSILIGIAGILAIFILVFIFSKKAIAPIVESYEKQKQFITNASHELKTPLAIISTNTEVIEMDYGENQWTKSILNQVKRLSELIGGLVCLARMNEEENQLIKVEFSLSDAITEAIEPFKALGKSCNKDLILEIENNISYIGNEENIRQLVEILLDNAIKYGLDESPIKISLKSNGKKQILQVENQGSNLETGNCNVLFERFYRKDGSRNSETGGYGIGLSIAKAIVEKHKGKINAECHDARTIIFRVQL